MLKSIVILASFTLFFIFTSLVYADGSIQYLAAHFPEAKCLDGSSAALYIYPGTVKTSVIFMQQGGGMCSSPESCYNRSKTELGSSSSYPSTLPDSYLRGFLSRNCSLNPGFCQFTVAYLRYCDGAVFASNLETPLVYNNTPLYFKGDAIRKAALSYLINFYANIYKVDEIIYSGESAGGYSTFLHSDVDIASLIENIPSLKKAAAIPFSGLFPVAPNVEGQPLMKDLLTNIINMANTTGSTNPACLSQKTDSEKYTCSIPTVSFNYSTVPTFVVQSHTDAWQILCELAGQLNPDNSSGSCMGSPLYAHTGCPNPLAITGATGIFPFEYCNQTQMNPIISYQQIALNELKTLGGFQRPSNGVFMISCLSHTASELWYWTGTRVRGSSMNKATWKWWTTLPNDRSWLISTVLGDEQSAVIAGNDNATHVYVDCVRSGAKNGNMFWECNPSCVNPVSSSNFKDDIVVGEEFWKW